jgi:hypothetical protein
MARTVHHKGMRGNNLGLRGKYGKESAIDISGIDFSGVERPSGHVFESRNPESDCGHIRRGHVDQRYSPRG